MAFLPIVCFPRKQEALLQTGRKEGSFKKRRFFSLPLSLAPHLPPERPQLIINHVLMFSQGNMYMQVPTLQLHLSHRMGGNLLFPDTDRIYL